MGDGLPLHYQANPDAQEGVGFQRGEFLYWKQVFNQIDFGAPLAAHSATPELL